MDILSISSSPQDHSTAQKALGQWVQEQQRAEIMRHRRKGPKNPIAERTQRARLKADLTQEQVAELLGVHKDTYAKWENRGRISDVYIEPFCTVVRVDPGWLITGKRWPANLHTPPDDESPYPARARKAE